MPKLTLPERPDLTRLDPGVRSYIEALEADLARLRSQAVMSNRRETAAKAALAAAEEDDRQETSMAPSERPSPLQLITLTANGIAKRTPRHLYIRQRRGGMGVFDLDTTEDEPPALLVIADESQSLLLFSNYARTFRIAVSQIPMGEIRGRGQSISARFGLSEGEKIVATLPDIPKGGVALVSENGFVRYLRHHVFGEYMKPGTVLFDSSRYGSLAGACRTPGDSDLFIATRGGKAIRFSEKLISPSGGAGIRMDAGDAVVAITSVTQDSGVFLIDAIGRGAIRLMNAFNANKSAGGGGKIAMNTDQLVTAVTLEAGQTESSDLLIISRLSKIIRFMAAEVPAKEGAVQGVNCMALRADEVAAVTVACDVQPA